MAANPVKPVVKKNVDKSGRTRGQAYVLNYSKLFWVFIFGCVVGVAVETLWCILTLRRIESRAGVIYGPFNPVYGFGAVLLTTVLKRLCDKRDLWVFLGGMVIGGGFEYLCSFLQELVFGTVSWEYSGTQFNFNGRTNLMYSFFWGLLGLVWVKEVFPRISLLVDRIPKSFNKCLIVALTVFMSFNMIVTAFAIGRQSQRRLSLPADSRIDRFLDKHYPDEFLKRKFPNMKAVE